jgi:hypothetical protein
MYKVHVYRFKNRKYHKNLPYIQIYIKCKIQKDGLRHLLAVSNNLSKLYHVLDNHLAKPLAIVSSRKYSADSSESVP